MMAQLQFIKQSNDILIPATPETSDFLHSTCKLGAVLEANFTLPRNPAFHRSFFALLNLGFEYWIPSGGTITPTERKLVTEYARYLAAFGGSHETLQAAADEFLSRVSAKRQTSITATKSFDAFREWVTIQAGYYDIYVMPNGEAMKKAKSISFVKMDETQFLSFYKSALDVIWNYILFRTFPDKEMASNAAEQLLSFAR